MRLLLLLLNIDGEELSDLKFADDVALTTGVVKDMDHQINSVNEESSKISLKIKENKIYDKYCYNRQQTDRWDRNREGDLLEISRTKKSN